LNFHAIKVIVILLGCLYCIPFADSSDEHKAYCSGLKQCLAIDFPGCSEEDKKPNPDLKYDENICGTFHELESRGIDPLAPAYAPIYTYLGGEYRVLYSVGGVLPVNVDMMTFLMNNMPFTARLINAYQGTNYTLGYVNNDKRNFFGDNGRSLSGRFQWLRIDSAGALPNQRHTFWGNGGAKVLMWQLHGVAVVFLDYDPIDRNSIKYRLRCVVFPSNAFLNSVMKMDMFRDVVMDKMKLIVSHVEGSARMYAQGNRKPIDNTPDFQKVPWLHEQLGQFEYIVQKSGYGQKVWPPKPKTPVAPPKPSQIWNPVPVSQDTATPTLLIAPKP